jgi:hypothetical protein
MIKLNLIKTEIKFIAAHTLAERLSLNLSLTQQRFISDGVVAFSRNIFCDDTLAYSHRRISRLPSLEESHAASSKAALLTPRLLQFSVFKEQVCNRRGKRVRPVADSPLALVRRAFGTQTSGMMCFVPRFFSLHRAERNSPLVGDELITTLPARL